MLAFIAEVAFCTVAAAGPLVVHAPIIVDPPRRLRFHISRANRAADLDGKRAIVSCLGPEAYISPDWYGVADQVLDWNYLAAEAEGVLSRLDQTAPAALLDDLSAATRPAPRQAPPGPAPS